MSNISYPSAFQNIVSYISFTALRGSLDYIIFSTFDLLNKLYLSTQQYIIKPTKVNIHPNGIKETYRKVNHIVYNISAYLLPMSQGQSYMIKLAYFCVMFFFPYFIHLQNFLMQYCGCKIHNRLTTKALKKNIIVSPSITPYSNITLSYMTASTMIDIIAVVKNIPMVYLHAQENSLQEEVSGISMSLNQCRNIFIMYLLKNCIKMRVTIKRVMEWDCALKTTRKQNTPVAMAKNMMDNPHPSTTRSHRLYLGQLTLAQIISRGSGADYRVTWWAIQKKCFSFSSILVQLNFSRINFFCSLDYSITIAFSLNNSSFWYNSSIRLHVSIMSKFTLYNSASKDNFIFTDGLFVFIILFK